MTEEYPYYPENKAEKVWTKDTITFSLVHYVRGAHTDHWCGYARFPARSTIEQGYGGILTYVPVHGGITYARLSEDDSFVYGFDCAHAGDDRRSELRDPDWLSRECEKMAACILIAVNYEPAYLLSTDDPSKADVIDRYHQMCKAQVGATFDLQDNFGSMINALFGNL